MSQQITLKPKFFISLHLKLLVSFTILFSCYFIGTFLWFYDFVANAVQRELEIDMVSALNGAATGIEVEEFAALAQEGSLKPAAYRNDPRYQRHLAWLKVVERMEPRIRIETFVRDGKSSKLVYIGSSTLSATKAPTPAFFEPVNEAKAQRLAQGLLGPTLFLTPFTDAEGTWVSSVTPLRNKQQQVIGGIKMDFRAGRLLDLQAMIRNQVAFTFILIYFSLLGVAYIISRTITDPLIALTTIVNQVNNLTNGLIFQGGQPNSDLESIDLAKFDHFTKYPFNDEVTTLGLAVRQMLLQIKLRVQDIVERERAEKQYMALVENIAESTRLYKESLQKLFHQD